MSEKEHRVFDLAGYLLAGSLGAVVTGLVAPRGGLGRPELLLHCLAVGLFGAMVWTSVHRRSLFPALLLIIVVPVFSELLCNPATSSAALATAARILLPVAGYFGAACICRTARRRFLCGLALLTLFVAAAHATGAVFSSLLLGQPVRFDQQSAVAGISLGVSSGLLFGLVESIRPGAAKTA